MTSLWGGVLNVLRGFLIGLAEIVPGVSGGTIALIVGVYQTLISSAASIVRLALSGFRRTGADSRGAQEGISWPVVIPVALGMVAGIFGGAALLEPLLDEYPVYARAVFAGLILASLWVPLRMVGSSWTPALGVGAVGVAGATFVAMGLPALGAGVDSLLWVAPAAAVAVCALVLPGVSGSYLLVTLGMYQPTLEAVNTRDFAYLGVFVLGAIVGLAAFVRVLQWLLASHTALTLTIMTGLMLGSLRALWPWQGEDRTLLAPADDVAVVVGCALAGVLVVVGLIIAQAALARRHTPSA